ncbi:MAG: ABC transporter permease [Myxococcota bacterium]
MVQGLFVQYQVIRALVLRETRTRFGQHRLGYVWALVEPITWMATFTAMYVLLGRTTPSGVPVIPFLATGIIPYLLFRETVSRAVVAIDANKGLLFYPDIRPLDLVAARVLLEIATNLVVFILIMGGLALWHGALLVNSWLTVVLGLLLASGLGASLGLVFCGLSTFTKSAERIIGPLLRPLFWTSAIFYSSDALPPAARDVLLYNPVLHAVELVRDGWFPTYHATHVNAWYPSAWIVALAFFGLTLERVARRRIQLT